MSPSGGNCSVVDVVSGPTLLNDLSERLDELHRATGAPVTARRPWLDAWTRSFTAEEAWAVVVTDPCTGRLDAAALLGRRHSRYGLEVANLGHGRNDRTRLPVRTAAAVGVLAGALVESVGSLAPPWVLRLEQLPERDPVAAAIVRSLPEARTIRAAPVPKVRFGPETDLDAYLGKGLRKQLRRCRQRLADDGVVASTAFDSGAGVVADLIDEIERTHRDRDHALGRRSDIDSAEAARFWRSVILEHSRRGELEVASLRLAGELAAYVVSLLDDPSYRVLDGRFATGWARYSPGRLLETATIARALANPRFVELDWMNSVASEKLVAANAFEWTEHLVACSPDMFHPPTTGDPGGLLILDEVVEGQPTADMALAALVGSAAGGPGP